MVIFLVISVVALIFEPAPEPAVLVAVTVVLNGWTAWYAVRFRRRGRWLVPVDVAVVCAVCVTQRWAVQAGVSAEGVTWVIGVAGITVIAYAWQLSLAAHVAATVAVMAAYLVGAAIADPQGWLAFAPVQLWLVIEAGLSRALYLLVRHGARSADAAIAHAERVRRQVTVTDARQADELEYLAALHDTASATLLMVGSGVVAGRQAWLSEQAARDLDVLNGRYAATAGETDLFEQLRRVAAGTPLTVRWDVPEPVVVPAVDAATMSHGVREALTNVVRHADVSEATVSLYRNGNTVFVEVADGGVGFDAAAVDGHRYGVTRSLVERMARTGGQAEVISSPGEGTRVRLERELGTPEPSAGDVETISTNVGQALRWSVLVMNLIILFGLDLPKLLANQQHYRPLWAQLLSFSTLVAVTLVVAARLWRRRPLGWLRWPLAAAVFAVTIAATASVPSELRLGIAHWSEGDAAWTLVLVVMDTRLAVFIALVVAQYAGTFLHTALGGEAGITVSEAVNATVIVFGYQLTVGIIATVLRPVAVTAAFIAHDEERLRTERAVADQIHRDRTDRYADLAETTAPVLARLASGESDPGDATVRRACAVEAARMRRLFAEDAAVPDPLSHELRACIELAERNGTTVWFAERGERPPVPTEIRRALTEPAVAALATAASTARVTVIGSDDEITVSVLADAPADFVPTTGLLEVEVSTAVSEGQVWVIASWRRQP
jgi:signal transduction histidine kinase